MDIQDTSLVTVTPLSELTDTELLERYSEAGDETGEFENVKAELEKRGYSFESEDEEKEKSDAAFTTVQSVPVQAEHYSSVGSLIWEISLPLIALAGAIYFLVSLDSAGQNIGTKTWITASITVLFLSSMGFLVGGIRRLINKMINPRLSVPSVGYLVLTFLWSACIVGGLYFAIKNFAEIVEFSFKYALISAAPSLVGAIIAFAFASMFYILSKEMKN